MTHPTNLQTALFEHFVYKNNSKASLFYYDKRSNVCRIGLALLGFRFTSAICQIRVNKLNQDREIQRLTPHLQAAVSLSIYIVSLAY